MEASLIIRDEGHNGSFLVFGDECSIPQRFRIRPTDSARAAVHGTYGNNTFQASCRIGRAQGEGYYQAKPLDQNAAHSQQANYAAFLWLLRVWSLFRVFS